MDEIVKAALAKWPNVPHCHGWLGLDARGQWYMRDDRTQAAGPFPRSKGSLLQHDKLIAFIHRRAATSLTLEIVDAAGRVESGEWVPAAVHAADLPQQHAYVQSPAAMKKAGR